MSHHPDVVLVDGWKTNGTWKPSPDEREALYELDVVTFDPMCSDDVFLVGERIASFGHWDAPVIVDITEMRTTGADVPFPSVGPASGWDRGVFFVGHTI
jgi:hypothetical protein